MLSRDTGPEIEQMQVERWRQMTAAEKLRQVSELRETVLELARKVYPEINALDDPRP